MDEPIGVWISFELASEEVERRLGLNWGAAQKTLMDACKAGYLCTQPSSGGRPDVSSNDLERWLDVQTAPKSTGRRPRIKALLAKIFPKGVPAPAHCPRKDLARR